MLDVDMPATSSAIISENGKYRYLLRRKIGESDRACLFVMLNPSTADADQDDPTIRRCMAYTRAWGFGELWVVNLFAIRATDPSDMMAADDPVGPDNMTHVKDAVRQVAGPGRYGMPLVGPVICAWGAKGGFMGQDQTVLGWIDSEAVDPMCLRMTKSGHPSHPLYLPKSLRPVPITVQ